MLELATRSTMVDDLVLAERFYAEILGQEIFGNGSVDTRYMLSTDEFLESRRRAETREPRDGAANFWANRPPHSNVTVGRSKVSLYLAGYHRQETPPEQLRGAPRLALTATVEQIGQAMDVLARHAMPYEGPVQHGEDSPAVQSLYFKDPAGNFLELCQLRDSGGER